MLVRHSLRTVKSIPARLPYRRLSPRQSRCQHTSARSARNPGLLTFLLFGGVAYGAGYYFNRAPWESTSPKVDLERVDFGNDEAATKASAKIAEDARSKLKGNVHPEVIPLSVQEATARIRANENSFPFGDPSSDGGWVHSTCLASNSPIEDFSDMKQFKGPDSTAWHAFAIYDGHAGWSTAARLANRLIPELSTSLGKLPAGDNPASIDAAIKHTFIEFDKDILAAAELALEPSRPQLSGPARISLLAPALSGSCALLALYSPVGSILRVACVGDSRAVLGRASSSASVSAIPLSVDQTGFNEAEKARIAQEHPGETPIDTRTGRVLGLAITRAFGDSRFKWSPDLQQTAKDQYWSFGPRPNTLTPPYVTAEPEIVTTKVQQGDFVIMASDGLWDRMSSDDAVRCVEGWLRRREARRLDEDGRKDTSQNTPWQPNWRATPEHFVYEDENVATCLVKNALGGARRELFSGVVSVPSPQSRQVRDDITVHVLFFKPVSSPGAS